jgi:hypothetical protein
MLFGYRFGGGGGDGNAHTGHHFPFPYIAFVENSSTSGGFYQLSLNSYNRRGVLLRIVGVGHDLRTKTSDIDPPNGMTFYKANIGGLRIGHCLPGIALNN